MSTPGDMDSVPMGSSGSAQLSGYLPDATAEDAPADCHSKELCFSEPVYPAKGRDSKEVSKSRRQDMKIKIPFSQTSEPTV